MAYSLMTKTTGWDEKWPCKTNHDPENRRNAARMPKRWKTMQEPAPEYTTRLLTNVELKQRYNNLPALLVSKEIGTLWLLLGAKP